MQLELYNYGMLQYLPMPLGVPLCHPLTTCSALLHPLNTTLPSNPSRPFPPSRTLQHSPHRML